MDTHFSNSNNPNTIQFGNYVLPIAIVSDMLSYIPYDNNEYLSFITITKDIYQIFNNNIKKILFDKSFDETDYNDSTNYFLKKYIKVYPELGPYDWCDVPDGLYRNVLFSAAKRNDDVMLNIALQDPRIKEMKPYYKINFDTHSGFVDYDDGEMTDDESYAGITLLGVAAERNSYKAVKAILEHSAGGETANSVQCWGFRVLSVAAWNSGVESVRILIEHGGVLIL
jgi:hypothetical protein